MGGIAIRRARAEDREALCRLYHEFHQYHAAGVPDRLVELGVPPESYETSELFETLAELIGRDDAAVLVSEADGELVGMAEVYVRDDEAGVLRRPWRYALLQSLFVSANWRRRGIGRALLAAAEAWAEVQGAVEVRVDTWEFGGDPVGFYQAVGYRTLRRTMVRSV
ncbi:GNAT family N-acetyltransferase [Candidatus Bipolaricaulota bacterium]|nr:GNAT family N-acetyltransferase [Candidatus Bipolaricaulota bacterium]